MSSVVGEDVVRDAARPGGAPRIPARPDARRERGAAPWSRGSVRDGLLGAWSRLRVGDPDPDSIGGQLLRPRFALAALPADRWACPGETFWSAALAVQLAHEASVLHDDVIDGAERRRDAPTLVETRGVGAALIAGDQALARGYLAAARTESPRFVEAYAQAVERTIRGERDQGAAAGRSLRPEEARRIARAKSGELFGCALAAHATLADSDDVSHLAELGRDIGLLYQRVDDLLDFCPRAGTGKPPLADASSGLWTWPREYLREGAEPHELFLAGPDGSIPAWRTVDRLGSEGRELLDRLRWRLPGAAAVGGVLEGWIELAGNAVRREIAAARSEREPVAPEAGGPLLDATVPEADPAQILARHGRSFHFAARLMPGEVLEPVARLYAFCRRVDDTVDRAADPGSAERALDALERETRRAYAGCRSADSNVFDVMTDLRSADASFELTQELFEGVRMDLRPRRYESLDDLRVYTYRVAGVVGLWMAGLARCSDPWALRMAAELGHAMQLTNIARDVGADLAMGRIYLPLDLLERHGLDEARLRAIAADEALAIPPEFVGALEELMGWADAAYGAAFQAIPALPPGFRSAVAVAARVYRGIQDEIRGIGHDTLRRRAHTGRVRKGILALGALKDLRSAVKRTGS